VRYDAKYLDRNPKQLDNIGVRDINPPAATANNRFEPYDYKP